MEHQRAQELMLAARIEALPENDQSWLAGHLLDCSACGELTDQMDNVMRQLRAVPVFATPGLVRATQSRVRARAREMAREQARSAPMLLAGGLVVFFALLSAPFLWTGFNWLGEEFNMPTEVWQIGFLLFYIIPAGASVMLAVLHHRKSQEETARR